MATTVVFVHGACVRDQAWWWGRMVAPLAARGLATAAVDLPSCQMPAGATAGLHDDAAAVTAAVAAVVDREGGPVVLVGHSYGGVVITEAGVHDAVTHLAYLDAVVPDAGESLAGLDGPEPAPWMDPGDDGTVGVHTEHVRELFLHDCDDATVAGAVARLTRQSARPFGEAPAAVAWRTTPATFVVCADDRAIPAERQRAFAARIGRSVEVATGHFPFLARPDVLAGALADIAGTD